MMKKYKIAFIYEEEVEATDRWEALLTVAEKGETILENFSSDATVEEITNG